MEQFRVLYERRARVSTVFMCIRLMPGTEIPYMTCLLRSICRLHTASPRSHGISVRFRVCRCKFTVNIHLSGGGYDLIQGMARMETVFI